MGILLIKLQQAKRRLRLYVAMFWVMASTTVLSAISLISGVALGVTHVLAGDPAFALALGGFVAAVPSGLAASWFVEARDELELTVALRQGDFDREIQYETDRILRSA